MRKDIDLMFLIKEHRYKVNPRDVICFQSMLRKAIQSMVMGTDKSRSRIGVGVGVGVHPIKVGVGVGVGAWVGTGS